MPQTKQQIEQLLIGAGVRPRHKWGQNFLIDLNLMRLLVDAAELTGNELVLEVGPGTGSLTSLLAERAGAVVAVEIDPTLAGIAAGELAGYSNAQLINTDVLARKSELAPEVLAALRAARARQAGRFLLIANLPYQVAAPLIIDLLLLDEPGLLPEGMFVTVQAEVADRMTASAGTGEYGSLSIMMQGLGEVKQLRSLPPQAFWPAPRVHSAMVAWRLDREKFAAVKNRQVFKKTIDLLLGHRRKKISTCLAAGGVELEASQLLQAEIDPDARGETLVPEKFIRLADLIADYGTKNSPARQGRG